MVRSIILAAVVLHAAAVADVWAKAHPPVVVDASRTKRHRPHAAPLHAHHAKKA